MHSTPHHHLMGVTGQCHTPDNILTAGRAPGTQWVSWWAPELAGMVCRQEKSLPLLGIEL